MATTSASTQIPCLALIGISYEIFSERLGANIANATLCGISLPVSLHLWD